MECCLIKRGSRGETLLTSALNSVLRESALAMECFVIAKTPIILSALGLSERQERGTSRGERRLVKAHQCLHLEVPAWRRESEVKHTAYQAPMAVALISLLIGRRPREGVTALGDVTAEGELSPPRRPFTSTEVRECHEGGIRKLVVASEFKMDSGATQEAAVVLEDGQPRLTLLRTSNLLLGLRAIFIED